MADKYKQADFVVTDRRKFTFEGEPRPDGEEPRESEVSRVVNETQPEIPATRAEEPPVAAAPAPIAPSAAEQQQRAEEFHEATGRIDERLRNEIGGRRVQPTEMDFQGLVSSLYMTAAMQLGLAAAEGMPPQIDIIGARQTIDMVAIIAEKTKGNLSDAEANLLQNCLYDLRMAYIEMTNQLARMPKTPQAPPGKTPGRK